MSGGNYSLTGGFWAISAIQTVGAPTLYISQSGNTSELADAADLLTDTLLSHLAYEERELIDPLARYGFYGYDQDLDQD